MTSDKSDQSTSNQPSVRSTGNTVTRRADPMVGTVLAERYKILEIIGRGGMGVVYKARHELMERVVAIKMMLPQFVSDDTSLERFRREAKAASRISHPNIIAIHDYGFAPESGTPYIVMDYLEGQSLSDTIKKDGQLGVTRTVNIFSQVCEALEHAHRLGILHRDMKPGNIMLVNESERDFVKVVDFGVAKMCLSEDDEHQRLTGTGEIFGSPVYMSPEQCNGDELTPATDVYALGCVLYETLTGKLPLCGKTVVETITRHLSSTAPSFAQARPDLYIPEWLEQIVFKALEKDPKKRHQSMQEMRDELILGLSSTSSASNRALTHSIKTRALSPNHRSTEVQKPKAAVNRGLVIGAVALIAGLAAGGIGFMIWQSQAPKRVQATSVEVRLPKENKDAQSVKKNGTDTPQVTRTGSTTATEQVEKPPVVVPTRTAPVRPIQRILQAHKPAVRKIVERVITEHTESSAHVEDSAPRPHSKRTHLNDNQRFYDFATRYERAGSAPSE